ncbi:hypothetical protein BH11BAC2_BH11BAC2_23330 [soil metagenome]
MKKQITVFLLLAMFSTQIFAQTKSFENVTKFRLRNSGIIQESGTLAGYFVFYLDDKIDKKNDAYLLQILDNNLNSVKSINVLQPRGSFLLEAGYNGKSFAMMYYSKGDLSIVAYDKTGKKLGEKKYEDISRIQKAMIESQMQQDDINPSISPLGESGFVKQSLVKNDKYGYTIEAFGNDMSPLWTYGSDVKSDLLEVADVVYSSSKYVVAYVIRKKSLLTNKMDGAIVVLDAVTGKKLFEKPMKEDSELSVMNCFVNEETNTFNVIGEYYLPGEEIMKSKSVGLFAMVLDKTGSKQLFKKISWAGDIRKFRKMDPDEKDKTQTYFHKVIRTSDNKIVAIGEQYKRQVSAMGAASQILSGGRGATSAAELHIGDMVVMTLDDQYNLLDFKNFEKKSTNVLLPQGAAYWSSALTAVYVKAVGGFDYNFTEEDNTRGRFYSTYTDFNRKGEDGKKADAVLGIIKYEDGKLSNERVPINTNGSALWFEPAKPGYIAVSEYFRKKKMVTIRLEKISY